MARSYLTGIKKNGSGSVYQEKRFFDFGGGLNNKYAPERIHENQSSDLLNVNFDQYPAIQSRNGYMALNTMQIDGNPITTLMTYNKSNGNRYLLATSGTSIYQWSGTAWTAIKTGLTGNGLRFSYQVFNDNLYMVNGVDGFMKWDGITFSTVTGAPNGKYLKLFKNHLFLCGDPNNANTLYFSDLGSGESWPSLDIIGENTNDGDVLNGIAVYKDMLIIFKERSKFIIRGSGPSYYTNVGPMGKGTVSHWSAVTIPAADGASGGKRDLLLFLARDGVYAFDGVQDHLISDFIQGSVNSWNQQYLSQSCAIDYGHKYWLSVPEGSSILTNTKTYIFDYIHNAWSRYNISAACFTVYQDSVKLTPTLYSGDVSQGTVYQQDTGSTDNGNPIDAYYVTKQNDLGNPAHFKRFKGLFLFAPTELQNYNLTVTYNVDFGKQVQPVTLPLAESTTQWGSGVWGSSVWGGVANIATKTTNIPGMGRYISFKIENNKSNQPWAFYGMVIRFKEKARMA